MNFTKRSRSTAVRGQRCLLLGRLLLGRLRLISFATAGALAATAQAANTPIADAIPALIPKGDVTVNLVKVADGFVAPVTTAVAPGDENHLYVVDQVGKLYAVNIDDEHRSKGPPAAPTLVLDVSARLVKLGLFGVGYDERGFLGVAFHPNFRHNGLLYTFTSEPANKPADFSTQPANVLANNQTVITEWHAEPPASTMTKADDDHADEHVGPVVIDPNSARELLRVEKPQFNHDGGTLAFGRDGLLYISLGDGGNANDFGVGHVVGGNGQSTDNVLGKILRIDPLGHDSANHQYGIPASNPFVGKPGIDEIWAYGFRNPYRMSFDRKTGALLVADVGQNDVEEVDIAKIGGNFGWPVKEGTFLFDQNNGGLGFVFADSPGAPAGLIDPIAQYDHKDLGVSARIAIIGGFMYRGEHIKSLRGRYVFGDYNTAFFSPAGGHIYFLDAKSQIKELNFTGQPSLGTPLLGFGQDHEGEIYALVNSTGVLFGTTGAVYRLEEPRPAKAKGR